MTGSAFHAMDVGHDEFMRRLGREFEGGGRADWRPLEAGGFAILLLTGKFPVNLTGRDLLTKFRYLNTELTQNEC